MIHYKLEDLRIAVLDEKKKSVKLHGRMRQNLSSSIIHLLILVTED